MHAWYFALSYLVTRKTSYIASDFYESYLNKKLIVWFQLYEKKPDVFQRAQSFVEWAVGKPPQFVTLQNVLPLLAYLSAEGWQGPSGTEIRLRGGRRSSSKNTLKGKKRTRKALKRKNRH
jgi:hypothetical protein